MCIEFSSVWPYCFSPQGLAEVHQTCSCSLSSQLWLYAGWLLRCPPQLLVSESQVSHRPPPIATLTLSFSPELSPCSNYSETFIFLISEPFPSSLRQCCFLTTCLLILSGAFVFWSHIELIRNYFHFHRLCLWHCSSGELKTQRWMMGTEETETGPVITE